MNTDFRVDVDVFSNLKIQRLKRRYGNSGLTALFHLWAWTAANRSCGVLSGVSLEDLDVICDWDSSLGGSAGEVLASFGFLDKADTGAYVVHDWQTFQQWAAWDEERGNFARLGALAKRNQKAAELAKRDGRRGVTKEEYAHYLEAASQPDKVLARAPSSAPSPSPSPSPSPPPAPYSNTAEAKNKKNEPLNEENRLRLRGLMSEILRQSEEEKRREEQEEQERQERLRKIGLTKLDK